MIRPNQPNQENASPLRNVQGIPNVKEPTLTGRALALVIKGLAGRALHLARRTVSKAPLVRSEFPPFPSLEKEDFKDENSLKEGNSPPSCED